MNIQALLENHSNLNFNLIKVYADLFDEWEFIKHLKDSL